MPTFTPGWNSVPLCRTMMLPGAQRWPPYILMPRYFGFESLLFWVEPPCFLDAPLHCCAWAPAAQSGADVLAGPPARAVGWRG